MNGEGFAFFRWTLRERRRAAGIRQRVFWLTDEQAEKVRRFIERLVKRSGK